MHRHHWPVSLPHRSPLITLLAALALAGGLARAVEPGKPAVAPGATPATAELPPPSSPSDQPSDQPPDQPSDRPPGTPTPAPDGDDDDPALYAGWATPQEPEPPPQQPITLLFTMGAYYSSAGIYIPLFDASAPASGERSEAEIYRALLGGALARHFLVLEASVNPLPCVGVAVHEWRATYRQAQVSADLNLVQALTAGFDEPFALSLFIGNVVDFDAPGRSEVRGRGYLGLVASGGLGHIKQNQLIDDAWLETELKLKGDRVSEEMKLSWSFRIGAKLHGNGDITDTAYLALRRSRVDYQDDSLLLANSGVEYRLDLSLTGRPVRQLLLVDKKFPLGKGKVTLVFGVGLLWESGAAYQGGLAESHVPGLQFIIRPNLVF